MKSFLSYIFMMNLLMVSIVILSEISFSLILLSTPKISSRDSSNLLLRSSTTALTTLRANNQPDSSFFPRLSISFCMVFKALFGSVSNYSNTS